MRTTPRLLVLEDEPLIAALVQDWLDELGCETVGPARTIGDAISLIEQGRPLDGAILDVSIGTQDCRPVADLLRQKGIPFALATGHGPGALASSYPGTPSLSKPYDFAAMQGVVAALLGIQASS